VAPLASIKQFNLVMDKVTGKSKVRQGGCNLPSQHVGYQRCIKVAGYRFLGVASLCLFRYRKSKVREGGREVPLLMVHGLL
jgi:hypothetical protein